MKGYCVGLGMSTAAATKLKVHKLARMDDESIRTENEWRGADGRTQRPTAVPELTAHLEPTPTTLNKRIHLIHSPNYKRARLSHTDCISSQIRQNQTIVKMSQKKA